jgi:flagellar basal-body rod modification protein FlgD
MATISGAAQVNSVVSASSAAPQVNPNSGEALKNEFITLMVAQIENQDPLNPTDGTEYVAQLAQFSQVESTENLVQLMQSNTAMLDNLQVLSTANLVDKNVTVRSDQLEMSPGSSNQGYIELLAPSNTVTIELLDSTGNVTVIPLGSKSAGKVGFTIDADQHQLNGRYQMRVSVDSGQNYSPTIFQHGVVEQVTTPALDGTSQLQVQGIGKVAFYEVAAFAQN